MCFFELRDRLGEACGSYCCIGGAYRKVISAALGPRKRLLNLVGKSTKLWLQTHFAMNNGVVKAWGCPEVIYWLTSGVIL